MNEMDTYVHLEMERVKTKALLVGANGLLVTP
jgi:hypothetical protein